MWAQKMTLIFFFFYFMVIQPISSRKLKALVLVFKMKKYALFVPYFFNSGTRIQILISLLLEKNTSVLGNTC